MNAAVGELDGLGVELLEARRSIRAGFFEARVRARSWDLPAVPAPVRRDPPDPAWLTEMRGVRRG
jgi:hypothetical protein